MPVPANLQSVLWSYDLSKLDTQQSKHLIITQVLNYGRADDLKWLLRTYLLDEIRMVVACPDRGVWFRDTLRHWLTKFDLEIDPMYFDLAIKEINPVKVSSKLYLEFFKRRGPAQDVV